MLTFSVLKIPAPHRILLQAFHHDSRRLPEAVQCREGQALRRSRGEFDHHSMLAVHDGNMSPMSSRHRSLSSRLAKCFLMAFTSTQPQHFPHMGKMFTNDWVNHECEGRYLLIPAGTCWYLPVPAGMCWYLLCAYYTCFWSKTLCSILRSWLSDIATSRRGFDDMEFVACALVWDRYLYRPML